MHKPNATRHVHYVFVAAFDSRKDSIILNPWTAVRIIIAKRALARVLQLLSSNGHDSREDLMGDGTAPRIHDVELLTIIWLSHGVVLPHCKPVELTKRLSQSS
jgi:hypothetical protein